MSFYSHIHKLCDLGKSLSLSETQLKEKFNSICSIVLLPWGKES